MSRLPEPGRPSLMAILAAFAAALIFAGFILTAEPRQDDAHAPLHAEPAAGPHR